MCAQCRKSPSKANDPGAGWCSVATLQNHFSFQRVAVSAFAMHQHQVCATVGPTFNLLFISFSGMFVRENVTHCNRIQ
jgi:hypothetical protein